MTAANLIADYMSNTIKSNETYIGEVYYVTGTINNINEVDGRMYIGLKSENPSTPFIYAFFYFDGDSQRPTISELKVGDTVTIKGKIKGFTLGVIVEECEIAE